VDTAASPIESAQPMQSMQPVAYEHPQSAAATTEQPNTSLSPKSAANQLKASPKSARATMAGVGTLAGHPSLKDHLPTYVHGQRPSSAGGRGGVAVGAPVAVNPWGDHQQPTDPASRAASPGSGAMSPWAHQGPHIIEPASRTDSTSPTSGYRSPHAGHHAVSPGGPYKPASAGPEFYSNQVTPYPAHRPTGSQQVSHGSANSGS
jgi:hypothetical protein